MSNKFKLNNKIIQNKTHLIHHQNPDEKLTTVPDKVSITPQTRFAYIIPKKS
jgi:hypothetical protein